MGADLTVNWKYFSLEQVNSKEGPYWKLWEQPEDYASRGRNAFRAAEAARKQGDARFEAFHHALLKARHVDRRDITDKAVLAEVAEAAGLDVARFNEDMSSGEAMAKLAADHTFAVENLSVFGTPTLVFPDGKPVFVKMMPPPSAEDSARVFDEVRQVAEGRPEIKEIKRTM
jgi:predicted DsbA family dithiol-disulfide isomerase